MCGTREYELGNAELPDTAQALEFGSIEKPPSELIERLIFTEYNQIVHRVTNALGPRSFTHGENVT
jgi:hypothetical protein